MIDYKLFKEIEEYAIGHLESSRSYYLKRKQNPDKIFHHILRGKIAEFNCYFNLKEKKYILEKPDLNIYQSSQKSTDADLVINGFNGSIYSEPKFIHVKSISKQIWENKNLPRGFLIQRNDKIVISPKQNHFFCVLVQRSLVDYRLEKWIKTTEAEYKPTLWDMPTKWIVEV